MPLWRFRSCPLGSLADGLVHSRRELPVDPKIHVRDSVVRAKTNFSDGRFEAREINQLLATEGIRQPYQGRFEPETTDARQVAHTMGNG